MRVRLLADDDFTDVPTDWLEAFVANVYREDTGEEGFFRSIEAIYRRRAIEEREGRSFSAWPEGAQFELLRRQGKPPPLERGQVYEHDGQRFEVTRISPDRWAELRADGAAKATRRILPLPDEFRLIGWVW